MIPVTIIDAPSSAGAYAPGQEKAPTRMRAAGFHERLRAAVGDYDEITNIETFRWRPDRERPRAMNAIAWRAPRRAWPVLSRPQRVRGGSPSS